MKYFYSLLAICISITASSQSLFSRYYADPAANMIVNDMIPTYDGGLVTLTTGVKAAGRTFILKMDLNGDTLWTKDVGDRNTLSGLAETSDHKLLLAGTTLTKLDELGNVIWSNAFGGPLNGGSTSYLSKVASNGAGGVLLTSELYQYWSGGNNYEAAFSVYNFDTNGDTLWSRHLTGGSFNSINFNVSVSPTAVFVDNSGYIYAVGIRSQNTDIDIIIWKLDSAGNTIWLKQHSTTNVESFNDAKLMSNGNIVLSGYSFGTGSGAGGRVVQIDSNGDLVWSKIITVPNSGRAGSIVELHNGDFAIGVENLAIGSVDYQNGLYITNDTLGVKATVLHGGESTGGVGKIVQLNDFGIVSTILTNAFSFQPVINYQKFDTLGNTVGCHEQTVSPSVVNSTFLLTDLVMAESQGGTYTSNVFATAPSVVEEFDFGYDITAVISEGDCFGDQGMIDISMNGNAPYEIQWSNGTTAEDLIDFSGTYSVVVEDASGCLRTDTFTLNEPTELVASYTTVNVDCFGAANGSIDLSVTGGTPGYSYQWSTLANTEDLSNLGGGFYQCIVSDTNGCNTVVGVAVAEPQQLTAVISNTTNVSCNGLCDGELIGFAAGGASPYTYGWNDPLAQTTDTASGLCYGNYLLTVTDANGCLAYSNATISEPTPLTNSTSTWESECFTSNGSAMAAPSGGTGPYLFDWDGTGQVSADSIGNLEVGSYDLQIEDANGCLYNEIFTIGSNTNPVEICVITVDSNNQNLIVWDKPGVTNIAGFNIYRNIAGVYTQIGYQPYDSISQFVDNDFGVDPDITSYRYKISVLDSCGNESMLSNFHETIHLTANLGVGGEVNLIWDDYEGFTFNEYEIWRDSTGQGDWETIGTTLSTSFTFTDNNVPADAVELVYAIEVVLPATCTAEKAIDHNSTRSNSNTIAGPGAELASSVEQLILQNMRVYPNPMRDQFTISLNANDWSYQLMDVSGRIIGSGMSTGTTTNVDVSQLEGGVYLINVELNGQFVTKKLLKQ